MATRNVAAFANVVKNGGLASSTRASILGFKLQVSVGASLWVAALALFLGASEFVRGLITALTVLAQLVQLPAAALVERRGDRRRLTVLSRLARRVCGGPVL